MLKAIPLLIFITQITYASPFIKMNELDGISMKNGEFFRTINPNEFELFIQKIKSWPFKLSPSTSLRSISVYCSIEQSVRT